MDIVKPTFKLVRDKLRKATFAEMVIVFTIAAVIGYFIETGYVFLTIGKLVKRGFLLGPYCPIYGFGALILYYCFYEVKPSFKNIPSIFIISSIILGSFELLCGLGFKYILDLEMWNYSGQFLNIMDYTTVPILIGWGILGTLYVFFIHQLILKIVDLFPKQAINKIAIILVLVFLCDWSISEYRINKNPQILENLVNPQNIVK